MAQDGFEEAMRQGLLSLPQDMKGMLRVMEDPDLDEASRVLASGSLLHVLSASNAIPGVKGILALVDDVLVLRLTLERISANSPDVVRHHIENDPDVFEPWAAQLAAARAYFGEHIAVIDKAVDHLPSQKFAGHTAPECARDEDGSTWLYDSVQEAIVEQFEMREADIERAVKSVDELLTRLRQHV